MGPRYVTDMSQIGSRYVLGMFPVYKRSQMFQASPTVCHSSTIFRVKIQLDHYCMGYGSFIAANTFSWTKSWQNTKIPGMSNGEVGVKNQLKILILFSSPEPLKQEGRGGEEEGKDWVKIHFVFSLNKLQFLMLYTSRDFINLCFLQKLNWIKTEKDQDRISCLVERFALKRLLGMPKACPWYAKDMLKICPTYVQHMNMIDLRYASDMTMICPNNSQVMVKLHLRYAQDLPKICARYVPDKPRLHRVC